MNKKKFKNISDKIDKIYENFIVENVNDHCLRIAVMQEEYKWHYHSNTDELFIVLEGELKIEIKDNGIGFSVEKEISSKKGAGIKNIQMRAKLFDGKVSIASKPSKGTQILITVPY